MCSLMSFGFSSFYFFLYFCALFPIYLQAGMAVDNGDVDAHFVWIKVIGLNLILGTTSVIFREIMNADTVIRVKVVQKVVKLFFLPFTLEGMVRIILQQLTKI